MTLFTKQHSHQSPSTFEKDQTTADIESGVRSDTAPIASLESKDEVLDPNIVWWDGPNDPANPRNWSNIQKYTNVALVSTMSFVFPLASSMLAPGVPQLMEEFHSDNDELASFVVSVYVIGFAVGPMVLAPMSEVYGRLPVYYACNVLFTIFSVACAVSSNLGMLIGFRLLAGAGSAPLSNGGGTISDLIIQEKRGASLSFYAMGPLLGPTLGPVAGGYLALAKGWRWNFWVITIASGACTILCFIFMRETYAKVILQKKTERLRKETGNQKLRSKLDPGLKPAEYFKYSIVLSLSVFIGLCFGCLYLLFCTYTLVFTELYHWDIGTDGLSFLGLGIGASLSLIIFGFTSDRILKYKAGTGELKPEYRLLPMIPGSFFIPAGLFWYGWAAHARTHWIVPILGTVLVGFGYLPVIMCITTYLVDAFVPYAASALAASVIIRSIMGAVIPLAGRQMYAKLGFGWGNTLLAFITTAMLPIPWLLYKYGEGMRKSHKIEL